MQRKENPLTLLVGMQTGAATLENSMEVPQKVKNRTTLRSGNYTTRYLSKRYENTDSKGHMHPNVYSSIFRARLWKEPKNPLTDEWLKKMWYMYMQWNITHPSK